MNGLPYDDAKLARLAAAWMTDDVAGTVSEAHLDQILTATGRMRPSPRWLALLKEPPMYIQTQTRLVAGLSIRRPILILAIVAMLVLALVAGLLIVGSLPKLPPLTGPARNGLVVTTNKIDGEPGIFLVDPSTGNRTLLIEGEDLCCAAFSPDGRRIDYLRGGRTLPGFQGEPPDPTAWVFAKLDGSTVAEVPAGALVGLSHAEWAPTGDRELMTTSAGATTVDVSTGNLTPIDVPFTVERASWLGGTGDIVLTTKVADTPPAGTTYRVYRVPAAGGDPVPLADLEHAVTPPVPSPDGTRLMYFIWGPEPRLAGRVHVFDLASGVDTAVTPEDEAANTIQHNVEDPHWSPDGSVIAAMWYFAGYDQLGITNVATRDTVFVGPKLQAGSYVGHRMQFSPDGASLVVYVQIDLITPYPRDATWVIPVTSRQQQCDEPPPPVPGERPGIGACPGIASGWSVSEEWGWQRLAP